MKNNMRKFVMIAVLLMAVGACAYAIDYPTYKSPVMQSGVYNQQRGYNSPYSPYTPHTVPPIGGTTTFGNNGGNNDDDDNNGGFGGGGYTPSGPRHALSVDGNGNFVGSPDETWEYNGTTYGYDSNGNVYFWDERDGEWSQLGGVNPGDVGAPFSPVGSPVLPMLFMALLAAGAVYLRRRKALQA